MTLASVCPRNSRLALADRRAVLRNYTIRDELTPLRDLRRAVIVLAQIVVGLLADSAGLGVPSATPLIRRRIGEPLGVRVGSLPSGLHHEYLPAPA